MFVKLKAQRKREEQSVRFSVFMVAGDKTAVFSPLVPVQLKHNANKLHFFVYIKIPGVSIDSYFVK